MKFNTIIYGIGCMSLTLVVSPAFSAPIPVRLNGIIWGVRCDGIVQRQSIGGDGIPYWTNVNEANPGMRERDIALKAFVAVCGFSPQMSTTKPENIDKSNCTLEHKRYGYPVWCR
jgi:hypothetical protein